MTRRQPATLQGGRDRQPEWALVHTGLFGTKATFVPLAGARFEGDAVRVPHETQTIKDAPRVDRDGQLSQAEEAQLYSHYGLDYSDTPRPAACPPAPRPTRPRPTGTLARPARAMR